MRVCVFSWVAVLALWAAFPLEANAEKTIRWTARDVELDGGVTRTWLPEGVELAEVSETKHSLRYRLSGKIELLRDDLVSDQVVRNLALANGGIGRVEVEISWENRWVPLQDLQPSPAPTNRKRRARDTETPDFVPVEGEGVYPYDGPLSGLTIALSPGHGWTWENGAWHTQRSLVNNVVEDHSNARLVDWHVIPQLIRAGARVFSVREADFSTEEILIDNDDASGYASENGWSAGSGLGWQGGNYDVCPTTQNESEQVWARFSADFTKSETKAVYLFFRAGENRVTDALVEIRHAGNVTRLKVNQERNDNRWLYLGSFYFDADEPNQGVSISNLSDEDGYVIADAVRFGGGMGTQAGYDPPGTEVSGYPRWQEAARYYCSYNQGPDWACRTDTDDRTGDITARPLYSRWRGADLFISWHSNAFNGEATGTRTITYLYDSTNPLADLNQDLRDDASNAVVQAIRAVFDSEWFGATSEMNLGEIRELADEIPGFLIETAFHDNPDDARYIVNPAFRSLVARAVIKSLIDRYAPGTGLYPLPVQGFRIRHVGELRVRLEWENSTDPVWPDISIPDAYRIYTAHRLGRDFDHGPVQVTASSYETELQPGVTTCFKVAALNDGGESLPSEVLCARLFEGSSANGLLVNGFDRFDRSVPASDNTRDYLARHAEAIAASGRFSFVSTSNEAIVDRSVNLTDYDFVDWALGEESTANHCFDATERQKLGQFLDGGGRLFVSGAEQGWDLVERGDDQTAAWYTSRLCATYEADDAGTHYFRGADSGPYRDVGVSLFDDGSGETYDVDWPDVVSASGDAMTCLQYAGSTNGAGVCRAEAPAVVHWGFPFETVRGRLQRAALMQRTLYYLGVPQAPQVLPEEEIEWENEWEGDLDEEPAPEQEYEEDWTEDDFIETDRMEIPDLEPDQETDWIEVEWIEADWAEEWPEPDGDEDLDEDKYIPPADEDPDDGEGDGWIPYPESEYPTETENSGESGEKPDERSCPEGFTLVGANCVQDDLPGASGGGCRSMSGKVPDTWVWLGILWILLGIAHRLRRRPTGA